jgi:hypothetical protein
VAQEVEEAEGEGELHPGRRRVRVESPEPPDEEREAEGLSVALGREARHRLDHPGPLSETLEILAEPPEWLPDVEMIEPDQRAALALEADRVAPGEELQRPGEP